MRQTYSKVIVSGTEVSINWVYSIDKTLLLEVRQNAKNSFVNQVELPKTFRKNIDQARLVLITNTLFEHNYLFTKKLRDNGAIKFRVNTSVKKDSSTLSLVCNLKHQSFRSPEPWQKIFPWLLNPPDESFLYPFQKKGVNWLLEENSRLLADDMGLGKTIQTISAMRRGFSENLFQKALIFCPKSLVPNWLAEVRKWAPELLVLAVSPAAKEAQDVWNICFKNAHVLISNYEQVRNVSELLTEYSIDLVVADEAHRLRNAGSQLVQSFRKLNRKRLWALSGTPIERDTADLATLMSLLDRKRFSQRDAKMPNVVLRERVRSYVLRRTKKAVLDDLPKVVTKTESLDLYEQQRATYDKCRHGNLLEGQQVQNHLQRIGELRRICDFDPISGQSIKLDRIHQRLCEIKDAGEKAIVFSYFLEPLNELKKRTDNSLKSIIFDGSMDSSERSSAIEKFKTDPTVTSLYASAKVASEGLTLVEANHAFFINKWWNPSSNNQAQDRINRIGQKKTVFIYDYVCIDTIEERIEEILQSKASVFGSTIGELESFLATDTLISKHINET
jgi:SNF2 family DNA or RNA helicase